MSVLVQYRAFAKKKTTQQYHVHTNAFKIHLIFPLTMYCKQM